MFKPLGRLASVALVPVSLFTLVLSVAAAMAQPSRAYAPIPIQAGSPVSDRLSDKDIPTGQGGFARDYSIKLNSGDQIAIDLTSENFDTIISLISTDGSTIAENDDGPDGSTNSLLFTRINTSGTYVIRVRAFGDASGGAFTLKVTRLKPA
ncbi:MAG: PPC domain-containing protein [Leptolyngbyaceae bacterium]|nr:PPC domain-containing protein [Leptolyngbyaceae bacterium]